MIKKINIFTVVFSLLLIGCSDPEEDVVLTQPSEYQPLKIGSWYLYDVDSIAYNDFTTPVTIDTFEYQLKEMITDTFTDQAGNLNYRLERERRMKNDSLPYDSLNWMHADVWFITEKGNTIERVEENNRYVSLMSPVRDGINWDGNAFNYKESWDFNYQKIGQPFDSFGNTVTVNQILEDQFVIIYQLYEEVYAKDVGLINRVRIDVESQNLVDPNIPVIDRAEKGYQFFQKLTDYYIP